VWTTRRRPKRPRVWDAQWEEEPRGGVVREWVVGGWAGGGCGSGSCGSLAKTQSWKSGKGQVAPRSPSPAGGTIHRCGEQGRGWCRGNKPGRRGVVLAVGFRGGAGVGFRWVDLGGGRVLGWRGAGGRGGTIRG